jgi:hypothetical protein
MVRQFAFILVCLFLHSNVSAQVKKSYFGKYVGTIAAYEMSAGASERIQIGTSAIEIQLSAKEIVVVIGTKTNKGIWTLVSENKTNFVIEGKMDNSSATEKILIYKKGKKIVREGIRPQPDVMLKKARRN